MIHKLIRGTKVPALGFGTYRLAGEECRRAVEDALELGYRHIDTAQGYDNEEMVGAGLESSGVPREQIFLVTKVRPSNYGSDVVKEAMRESLRKLRTEYVDLLLLHWPSADVPVEETLGALRELQDEGAVRNLGVSNFPSKLVAEASRHARIFANQVEYHPFLSQRTLLDQAVELDYLLTAYSPIAKGAVANDETLSAIGQEHGKSAVQVTLRWLVQQERVAAIPKASSPEHRRSNFDIFDFELSDEEMRRIHALERGQRLVSPEGGPGWDRD
jgi:2,5-diketo-D-gluconate reductase B